MISDVLIETMVTHRPFPCEVRMVSNYITKYLETIERYDLIDQYE